MAQMSAVSEQSWAGFRRLVQERFPHATLYGLRIERGIAVSYQSARFTRVFDRDASRTAVAETANERWERFTRFCVGISDGQLPEVHFRDGNPCLVQFEEPGGELKPLRA